MLFHNMRHLELLLVTWYQSAAIDTIKCFGKVDNVFPLVILIWYENAFPDEHSFLNPNCQGNTQTDLNYKQPYLQKYRESVHFIKRDEIFLIAYILQISLHIFLFIGTYLKTEVQFKITTMKTNIFFTKRVKVKKHSNLWIMEMIILGGTWEWLPG